jgi:arginase family enzyme
MNLTIISVPYAGGRREEGMGKGPSCYLAAGPNERLRELGHHVNVVTIRPQLEDAHDEPEAAALTAYDPDHERDDLTLRSGLRLSEVMADTV